ncbi:hypothetical protein TPHA_0A03240 [Tetrapisispora phaffii CBS 4417]|uniref:Uncharacterized protein n=1 Tax=Tetrapisispora phaffii (strain ATCC 24235 / CBS 4417 / NBRC 1672 / NRRL Y-8282 / UCD 70-5) TaxID=1071381 RepID=G8BNC3_TETPH|nr:hypothetical protein TPHA_0A03240 [Tetrapisispora phaffii CBS 4417]CCE61401.1 hypothetical protein TPHA_0A03240 [Tetrapisispora phaffii CBS 4417]
MVRIWHLAQYYMPLFSSNKPIITITSIIVAGSIYLLVYLTSSFLITHYYNDPNMFIPNSQDYFRTLLLGLFSPFLYYFIKKILLNIKNKQIITNIVFDFPLNDLYMFLLIICLAYPQTQDLSITIDDSGPDYASLEWHIIPRQSYLFGISWSLGEFLISICSNISLFVEVFEETGEDEYGNILDNANEDDNYAGIKNTRLPSKSRDEISLSQCLKVRYSSSTLSNNVYSSLSKTVNPSYGSTNNNVKNHDDPTKNKGKVTSADDDFENKMILVNPYDNSLIITTKSGTKKLNEQRKNKLNERNLNNSDSLYLNDIDEVGRIHYFYSISSTEQFLKQLGAMSLIILNNILLLVGQSLMLSIYFIYVRGHEHLFTKAVNYFGQRWIGVFLSFVVLPLILIDLLFSIILYFWKDVEFFLEGEDSYSDYEDNGIYDGNGNILINHNSIQDYTSFGNSKQRPHSNPILDIYRYKNTDNKQHQDLDMNIKNRDNNGSDGDKNYGINQDNSSNPNNNFLLAGAEGTSIDNMMYSDSTFYIHEEYGSGEPRLLRIIKKGIEIWRNGDRNDIFLFVFLTIYSISNFIGGLICTVYQ